MSDDVKHCETCGARFSKRPRDSQAQWADRAFCSVRCSNDEKKDIPPHLRFWKWVEKASNNQCWAWAGACDQHGYGVLSHRTVKMKAHRVSYEMRHGPIPEGMVICHVCDNPNCCNPSHLFLGTQKDNMQDASRKGRLNPKSLENLRPGAKGVHGAGPLSQKEIVECQEA